MQLQHTSSHKRTSTKRPKFNAAVLFEQVHDYLKGQIADGAWGIGAALPKEPDLARELGVSVGTVRKALALLQADGLVDRIQGRGTFILDKDANDTKRRLVCTQASLFIIKKATEDVGHTTTPELTTALQSGIANALFNAGYSGEANGQ